MVQGGTRQWAAHCKVELHKWPGVWRKVTWPCPVLPWASQSPAVNLSVTTSAAVVWWSVAVLRLKHWDSHWDFFTVSSPLPFSLYFRTNLYSVFSANNLQSTFYNLVFNCLFVVCWAQSSGSAVAGPAGDDGLLRREYSALATLLHPRHLWCVAQAGCYTFYASVDRMVSDKTYAKAAKALGKILDERASRGQNRHW